MFGLQEKTMDGCDADGEWSDGTDLDEPEKAGKM